MNNVRLIKLYNNKKAVGALAKEIMDRKKINKKYIVRLGTTYKTINEFLEGNIDNISKFARCFTKFRLVLGEDLYSIAE